MVVMLITVLNIVVAIALPLWSGMIRRDKEEELISRGLQYAEAIRVFQRRFGRLPVQLDELSKSSRARSAGSGKIRSPARRTGS